MTSVVVAVSTPAIAAPGDLLFKLTAPDPQPGARFSHTLAIVDGDILVGEPNRYHPDTGVGRAYLFEGNTGEFKLAVNNPEVNSQDAFAGAVVGGDGRIFLSAIGLEERVYVFSAESGEWLQRIDDPNAPPPGTRGGRSSFGTGIAYGDGCLMASAPSFDLSRELRNVGQSYLFDTLSGELTQTFPNPEPKLSDTLGSGMSLAVLNNKVIVGAMLDDLPDDDRPDGDNPGRVWVFDRDSGDVAFTLENPHPESEFFDWFGWSVAANEDIIVVGAHEDSTSGVKGSGTAYVFDSQTGALLHTLFSPQLEDNGEFGRSVALTPGGDIVVGAWRTSVDGIPGAGHVYMFDGQNGKLLLDIPNPAPQNSSVFGWSVAALKNRIVVGAPTDEVVYVFTTIPEPHSISLILLPLVIFLQFSRYRVTRSWSPCSKFKETESMRYLQTVRKSLKKASCTPARSTSRSLLVRRLTGVEYLEERNVLSASTAVMMGQEFTLPSWLSQEQVTLAQQAAAAITDGNDNTPVYTSAVQSYPVINVDDYFANPSYSRFDGSGYSIAILDTGADLDHPGFAGRIVYQQDFADGDMDANDVNGHGTNVAGIAAGVAPGANLIILKVFEDSGAGNFGYVEEALQWVVNNTALYNIVSVNMSLGDGGNYQTNQTLYNINDEIAALAQMEVTSVVAAGNSFYTHSSVPGVAYPAADPSVIAVGATYDANVGGIQYVSGAIDFTTATDRVASFSQRHANMLDIFAPGALITAAGLNGGSSTMAGTSQAAPHVAAAVALAQQIHDEVEGVRLDTPNLIDLLQDTGVAIVDGDNEHDNVTNTNLTFQRLDLLAMSDGLLPPTVINVTISNTVPNSPHAPFSFDTVDGSGQQLKTVPVGGADTVSIQLSEHVINIDENSLTLTGLITGSLPTLATGGFSYDVGTHTASWTFSSPFDADQYLISLADSVTDVASNALDGEWTNPFSLNTGSMAGVSVFPSGDGTAGGDFNFVITVLPGDANLTNSVNSRDFLVWQ